MKTKSALVVFMVLLVLQGNAANGSEDQEDAVPTAEGNQGSGMFCFTNTY